jgi:hypothetical protein
MADYQTLKDTKDKNSPYYMGKENSGDLECCGNCNYFQVEDVNGNGFCPECDKLVTCFDCCGSFEKESSE